MKESEKSRELNIHERLARFVSWENKKGYKKKWTSQKTDVSRTALLIYN